MRKFEIVVDSASDLEVAEAKALDVCLIPYNVSVDGNEFVRDRIDLSPKEFIDTIINNPSFVPKTATPSPEHFVDAFLAAHEKGLGAIAIGGTATLTSIARTAEAAKAIVLEKHPNAQIEVIDSFNLTAGLADYIAEAARLRDEGVTLEETVRRLKAAREVSTIFFFIQSTKYLHLGGRIGKVGAVATDLLQIKPLIVLKRGEIQPFGVIRSRKKGLIKITDAAVNFFKETGYNPDDYIITLACSAEIRDELPILEELVTQKLGRTPKITESSVGPAVTAHTGPGIIGVLLTARA